VIRGAVRRSLIPPVAQVRALAEAMPGRVRAMVYVQAGLGLRVGELALRVQDINFLGRTVRVEHQLERGTRARVEPKTPRSRRTIPLPAMVAEKLAAHIAAHPPLPDGSLFYGAGARPFGHDYYGSRLFGGVVDKLAAAPGSTFPTDTTTHDLRHHYASVLLAAGESVVAVAERLGHEDATMVLRVCLRPPVARLRGPHPQGRGRRLGYARGSRLLQGCHGPGTARVIFNVLGRWSARRAAELASFTDYR
jgi:integrase